MKMQFTSTEILWGGAVANDLGAFGISELDDAISEIEVAETNSKTKRLPYVQSFYKDYEDSIKTVARTVKKGGYVLYLVGNRRVRDVELPTDIITARMFEKYSFVHEKTIVRDILNKRMPKKTSPTNKAGDKVSTMKHEYLVILRKK
jgi:putative DNA (cytosine-5-)-methyltransferase